MQQTAAPQAEAPAAQAAAHYRVLIVGGGAAGITVAANLLRRESGIEVAIVEPAETHYYQPAFTLVGAGAYKLEKTRRAEAGLIPKEAVWIKGAVTAFLPDEKRVELGDGRLVSYDFLVVCPGLQLDLDKVDGLRESLGHNGVCSNYLADYAPYTWECIRNLKSGPALFTQPPPPIKCAGAPQKILYLAADHWRRQGITVTPEFCLAGDVLFGVPYFVPPLQRVVERYGITVSYRHNLVAVDGPGRKAVFEVAMADGEKTRVTKDFELLHVTPPQSAPDVVKRSPLSDAAGWVAVDPNSLQHPRYPEIFALGDVAGTTNSKTAAAIRKQAPVVVRNLLRVMKGGTPEPRYDGYASCPLITGYGRVIMAEFCYGGKVTPTLPLDPAEERRLNWWIKKSFLPPMYWNYMLRGYDWDIPHHIYKKADKGA